MTTANEANTPAQEQRSVAELENNDTGTQPQIEAPELPEPEPAKPEPRANDARAAMVEEIAAASRQNIRDEEATAESHMERPAAPAPVAPDPTATITLKVRGQNVGLTAKQRDELAAEGYADDIANLPDVERNRFAQMRLAERAYEKQIGDLRDELKTTKTEARTPAQPAPVAQPEPPKETPEQKRARALEIVQNGGSVAEATALLSEAENERLDTAINDRLARDTAANRERAYDADVAAGRHAASQQYPGIMADPISAALIGTVEATLQKTLIVQTLAKASEDVQIAFTQAGITPEHIASLTSDGTKALYRDMTLKGYRMPRPSQLLSVVAKQVTDRLSGATTPNAGQHPGPDATTQNPAPSVDRSDRKEGLTQPERVNLPRPGSGRAAPRTERQRANSNFNEVAAARARGAPVQRG